MWKAFARDVICMISAVIVMTVLFAALWFALIPWLVPPSGKHPNLVHVPFLAPIVAALAGVGTLLYAPLRGRARRGQLIRPPYERDTLIAPLGAGFVLGLGFVLWALLTGSKERPLAAFLSGLALTVPLALGACLVVLVQRFTARPARALAIAAAALLALWLGGRVVLDAWGDRIFAAYRSAAMADITAERQRIAADRRPVLFGTPIDDNAADRYRTLTQTIGERLQSTTARMAVLRAADDGPRKPRSAEVAHLVEISRPELEALREAVRCRRCDWHFPWERGIYATLPSLGARDAANLLVIEGHQRAERGDVEGATERYLEVVRMGTDYESSGALIGTLFAAAIERIGTNALLRLVASDGLAAQPAWDEVESKLDLLEPRLASMSIAYRGERLGYVGWESMSDDDRALLGMPHLRKPLRPFYPGRFFLADAARAQSETLRTFEQANEQADPREATRLSRAAVDRDLRSRNVLVREGLPVLLRARVVQDELAARFRLVRAAVRLERIWAKQGRYPTNATAIDLPIDPFAYPAKLHYASLADGRGYRLWSVGANGTDNGGIAKDQADEVFDRPPRDSVHAHRETGRRLIQP
jgi:hypothetical protein